MNSQESETFSKVMDMMKAEVDKEINNIILESTGRFGDLVSCWNSAAVDTEYEYTDVELFGTILSTLVETLNVNPTDNRMMSLLATLVIGARDYQRATQDVRKEVRRATLAEMVHEFEEASCAFEAAAIVSKMYRDGED